MKVSYKKNNNKNYIVLNDFNDYDFKEDFKLRMIKDNVIPGALTSSIEITNEFPSFLYDITSHQSFTSLFANSQINYSALKTLILCLSDMISTINDFLIDSNFLLLDPEFIYLDPETFRCEFIICPAVNIDIQQQLSTLFDYILKRIDHSDDKCVLLAYSISIESKKSGFNVGMLRNILYLKSNDNAFTINKSDSIEIPQQRKISMPPDSLSSPTNPPFPSNLFNLHTPNKSFMCKVLSLSLVLLTSIVFIIIGVLSQTISTKLSIFLFIVVGAISIGCIRYFLSIYDEARIPLPSEKKLIPPKKSFDIGNPFSASHPESPSFESPNSVDTISPSLHINSKISSLSLPQAEHLPTPCSSTMSNGFSKDLHIPKSNTTDNNADVFGNTVILSIKNEIEEPHLIYTGTDFTSDIPISSFPFTVGKLASSVDMIINNPLISRIHSSITFENGIHYIEDLNSSNGTKLNGQLLEPNEKKILCRGDHITFSHLTYIFK